MYKVPDEFVPNWSESGNERFPASVDIICPFCGRQVNFALTEWETSRAMNGRVGRSRCPGCGKSSLFLCVSYPPSERAEVYIHPTPKLMRKPVEGMESTRRFPEILREAYVSAINTYNVRQWTGAAVLIRRVLEGLVKSLLPQNKQSLPLAQQLQELPNHVDLQTPILMLADGIRKGGNIGAHFEPQKEPDQETTEMMIDLLDYIIEYLFVLPDRIEKLRDKIAASEVGG